MYKCEEQFPFTYVDQNDGTCKEVCGDGIKLTNRVECDDGNTKPGSVDGCGDCKIEEGWECFENDNRKSECSKTMPFKAALAL
ncbi:MAG: DUF4215 domain-containing protein [Anaerolineales bacterium]|nr:DUF4215 domain-containing protein [Anaerolineales bacterium]